MKEYALEWRKNIKIKGVKKNAQKAESNTEKNEVSEMHRFKT